MIARSARKGADLRQENRDAPLCLLSMPPFPPPAEPLWIFDMTLATVLLATFRANDETATWASGL